MELRLARYTVRDWRPDDAESLAKHANNRRSGCATSFRTRIRLPTPRSLSKARFFQNLA